MNKNYTLSEIKDELFREIAELEKADPSWLNCRKCPFKGRCCIDNDIDIREDEWNEIKAFLDRNEEARRKVKENFDKGSKCYFRTEECCLIHDIRPTNCIYTPYQAIQTDCDNHLIYSIRSEYCDFETVNVVSELLDDGKYIISVPGCEHKYLFLNHWVKEFETQSIDCYKEEGRERLREYFESGPQKSASE